MYRPGDEYVWVVGGISKSNEDDESDGGPRYTDAGWGHKVLKLCLKSRKWITVPDT